MAHQANTSTHLPIAQSDADVVAIERGEQGDWLQSAPNVTSILYAFANLLNEAFDLNAILNVALKAAIEFSAMDTAAVLLIDPSTGELSPKACIGSVPGLARKRRGISIREGMIPRMLSAVLATTDIAQVSEGCGLVWEKAGWRSLLSVPLVSNSRPQGLVILASYQERVFLAQEIELLTTMGRHLGSAIGRANLYAQELRAAVLEERQAIARQMHDDIAQTLGYLGLRVDEIMDSPDLGESEHVRSALEEIRTVIEKSYQHVRDSIVRLSQDIPEHFDLHSALRQIIDEFAEFSGHRVNLSTSGDWIASCSPLVAIQASYILQEALNNVAKHAQASTVDLSLHRLEDRTIELVIQDDGRGFDLASPIDPDRGGFGLRFMAERAKRVGGTFEVKSEPGRGTQIVVCLPTS